MSAESLTITNQQSGAFVELFDLAPTGSGTLDGLRFAVKDLIDVGGYKTGCGNPYWRDTHPVAITHAVAVEALLSAGARCIGKTVTDELAFSLLGENHFYGTPLNPHAPDHVPGGSSSGSASAVACRLADFALGTDTGGSVRVPASNCGIFGLRPSHDLVSVAGVNPFAPGFDTVGVLARDADVLLRTATALLACVVPATLEVDNIYLISEAFALADAEVRQALQMPLQRLRQRFGARVREVSLRTIDGEADGTGMQTWYETYRVLQMADVWSSLGAWISATKPTFGSSIADGFEQARTLDRRLIADMVRRRENYYRRLAAFLGSNNLLCLPTVPTPAPLKGAVRRQDQGLGDYYPRALSLTSVAGLGRLPQVSLPLAACNGLPVGLSLLAGRGQDGFLLHVMQSIVETA